MSSLVHLTLPIVKHKANTTVTLDHEAHEAIQISGTLRPQERHGTRTLKVPTREGWVGGWVGGRHLAPTKPDGSNYT